MAHSTTCIAFRPYYKPPVPGPHLLKPTSEEVATGQTGHIVTGTDWTSFPTTSCLKK